VAAAAAIAIANMIPSTIAATEVFMTATSVPRAFLQLSGATVRIMPVFGEPVCDDHHRLVDSWPNWSSNGRKQAVRWANGLLTTTALTLAP